MARSPKQIVEMIARENKSLDIGALKPIIDNAFAHLWMYLFELLQNALDAGATKVRVNTDYDRLVFQHDAPLRFDEGSVRALSKVGASTKRLDTVGFMGIGFKSVFHRFRGVRVSDGKFKFAYFVSQSSFQFDSQLLDWQGCVVPRWDALVPDPDQGYTTLFELSLNRHPAAPIARDLDPLIDEGPSTTIAVLGVRGLRLLELNGAAWTIELDGSKSIVDVRHESDWWQWRIFRRSFTPTAAAKRALLEHRNVRLQEGDSDAEVSRSRDVLALLSIGDADVPSVEDSEILATLPTDATCGVSLSIQADWLLDITRKGLMDVQQIAWQREIVATIPQLVGDIIRYYAEHPGPKFSHLLPVLGLLRFWLGDKNSGEIDQLLLTDVARKVLADSLRDVAFVPAQADGRVVLRKPRELTLPPWALLTPFAAGPALRPDLAFGGPTPDPALLDDGLLRALGVLGLLDPIGPSYLELCWPDGLNDWWTALGEDRSAGSSVREECLVLVLRALVALKAQTGNRPWLDLPCIPAEDDHFYPARKLFRLDGPLPTEKEPGGAVLRAHLSQELDRRSETPKRWLDVELSSAGKRFDHDPVKEWYGEAVQSITLVQRIKDGVARVTNAGAPQVDLLVALAAWAMHRNLLGAVTVVLTESGAQVAAATVGQVFPATYVAAPYVADPVADMRAVMHAGKQALSKLYLDKYPEKGREEWRRFFEERLKIPGAFALVEETREFTRWQREAAEQWLSGPAELGRTTDPYKCTDWRLPHSNPDEVANQWHRWIEGNESKLLKKGQKSATGYYHKSVTYPVTAAASWVRDLQAIAWVPAKRPTAPDLTFFARPNDVVLQASAEDDPVCQLDSRLVAVLADEGIEFATSIPPAGAIRSLKYRGSTMDTDKLSELLALLLNEVNDGTTSRADAASALAALELPHASGRVHWINLVKTTGSKGTARSSLGDSVLAIVQLQPNLQAAVAALTSILSIPDTTTGDQALRYLRSVWAQAAADPQMQTGAVADYLPAAYRYVVEDAQMHPPLASTWESAKREAVVFARLHEPDGKRNPGSWVSVGSSPAPLLDDLDGEFGDLLAGQVLATASHLGEPDRRVEVAKSLGLGLASVWLSPSYEPGPPVELPAAVRQRMRQVIAALAEATKLPALEFVAHADLAVRAKGKLSALSAYVDRSGASPVLRVTQSLKRAAAKIADRLLSVFEKSTRGDVATSLTAVLKDIDQDGEFRHSFKEFCEKLDVEMPTARGNALDDARTQAGSDTEAPGETQAGPRPVAERSAVQPDPDPVHRAEGNAAADAERAADTTHRDDQDGRAQPGASDHAPGHGPRAASPQPGASRSGHRPGGGPGEGNFPPRKTEPPHGGAGQHDKPGPREKSDRPGPDMRRYLRTKPHAAGEEDTDTWRVHKRHTDAIVKAQAVAYEARHGRTAVSMPDLHPGYDLESRDPATGRIRRIEVKGAPGRYVNDPRPSVTMSGEQFRQGYEQRNLGSHDLEYWLYVVDDWQIVPIPWTAAETLGFVFYAEDWLSLAVQPEARVPDVDLGSPEASAPRPDVDFDEGLDLDLFSSEWLSTIAQLPDFGIQVAPAGDIPGPHGVVGQAVAFLKRDDKIAQLLDARLADCLAAANALAAQGQLFVTALPTDPVDDVVASFELL